MPGRKKGRCEDGECLEAVCLEGVFERTSDFELTKGGSLYRISEEGAFQPSSSQRECKYRDLRQEHAWRVGGRIKRPCGRRAVSTG